MKMKLDEFNKCIDRFFTEVISPKAKPNTQFKIGVAHGFKMFAVQPDQLEDLKSVGVLDAAGDVDLDKLKAGLDAGFAATKEYHVDRLGIYLSKDDADRFFKFCETGKVD